jgi:dTDP-4-dehydrorhamnose reductase
VRVLVLGATGMLGHAMLRSLAENFETWGTVRRDQLTAQETVSMSRVLTGMDLLKESKLKSALDLSLPDVVINCVGLIKQRKEASSVRLSIELNSLLPHRIADECRSRGIRMIHISTDCVFSGARGSYTEDDPTDAEDLYGRTKALGEVSGDRILTLRTSIIGHEKESALSLVDWFLSRRNETIQGYTRAVYSGFPTVVLSREVARIISSFPAVSGLYQVSADPITKYDLLRIIARVYDKTDVRIEPYEPFQCDRSLDSTRYRRATGFLPPPWDKMIEEMHSDYIQHYSVGR